MTDIATLGLAIDSRQATQAKTALDALAASSKPAAAGFTAIEVAAARAAQGEAKAAAGAQGLAKHTGLARHELTNLSRQVQDIGTMAAMGASPFAILSSQGAQVYDIFSSSTGTLRGFASQVASVITPVRLLAAGVGAVGIAAVAMNMSWKSSELQFDDTSRAIGTTIGKLHALESAASIKGIETDDFLKAAEKFSLAAYQARSGAGSLAEVFRANGVNAKGFEESLERAADLIRNASSDQQRLVLLQQMGLPATMQWVRFLTQGKDGIRQAVLEAQNFDSTANGTLIRKAREFDEAWNRAWKNFSNSAKTAFIEVKGFFDDLSLHGNAVLLKLGVNVGQNLLRAGQGVPLQQDFSEFYNSVGILDPKQKATVDKDAAQRALSLEQQRISLLGQSASVQQQVRAVELQIQQARLNGIRITADEAANLKRLAEEQALGITQIRGAADAYTLEAETIGMSTGQATSYLAVQNAIIEAKRQGRTLTEDNIAAIQAEGNALGMAAQRAEDMRWGYENLVRGPLQVFRQELSRGANFFDALKKSGLSALESISSKLMDMAARNLWMAAFPGGGGGGGMAGGIMSLFGMVAHSGYGPGDAMQMRAVPAATFANAPRFHSGIGPGERAAVIRNDESVLTPGQMRQLAPAGSGGVQVTIHQENHFTNADPNSEARMRQWAKQTKDMAVSEAVQEVSKVHGSNPAALRGRR